MSSGIIKLSRIFHTPLALGKIPEDSTAGQGMEKCAANSVGNAGGTSPCVKLNDGSDGIPGPRMNELGVDQTIFACQDLAAGIEAIIGHELRKAVGILDRIVKGWLQSKPDLLVLIDEPQVDQK